MRCYIFHRFAGKGNVLPREEKKNRCTLSPGIKKKKKEIKDLPWETFRLNNRAGERNYLLSYRGIRITQRILKQLGRQTPDIMLYTSCDLLKSSRFLERSKHLPRRTCKRTASFYRREWIAYSFEQHHSPVRLFAYKRKIATGKTNESTKKKRGRNLLWWFFVAFFFFFFYSEHTTYLSVEMERREVYFIFFERDNVDVPVVEKL